MQLQNLNSKEGVKFGIGLAASVLMMFTPDNVDAIIQAVLPTVFGIDLVKLGGKE